MSDSVWPYRQQPTRLRHPCYSPGNTINPQSIFFMRKRFENSCLRLVVFPCGSAGKKICLQFRRLGFDPWVGKILWRRDRLPTPVFLGFPCDSAGKESTCSEGNLGSVLGLGRSSEEGKGYPLQYSGLENSMDYTVHGVSKSRTWLNGFYVLPQRSPRIRHVINYKRILKSMSKDSNLLQTIQAKGSITIQLLYNIVK